MSLADHLNARTELLRASDAKILTLDIERVPALVLEWDIGPRKGRLPLANIVEPSRTIMVGAKWYGQKRTMCYDERGGHTEMARAAWELLDQADIVIGYNHRRFDLKHLNAIFATEGWGPPSPYATIDLLATVRKQFAFDSSKLDWISRQLIDDSKIEHEGFAMWVACMNSDDQAYNRMARYCKHDVELTERVYDELRPWITDHPNVNLYRRERVSGCDKCGSDDLERRGYAVKLTGKYQQFRCRSCGGYSQATHAEERVHRKGAR